MNKPKNKNLGRLREENVDLRQQADEYLNGWKRCKADFENYKKQQQEWAVSFRAYASEDLLREIIPVIDNFELALNHIPEVPENKSWKEGVSHIKKQLEDILSIHNVKKIEVKPGDNFNPNLHECVNVKEQEKNLQEIEKFQLVDKVVRSGYLISGKLLRPAGVTIKLTND